MSTLYTLQRGNAPLLINVPHAGTYAPPQLRGRFTPIAQTLPDTDWHVPLLYDFARGLDVTLMVATHSRYVIDLNRDPSGVALYSGASNTELCPSATFADEAIYLPAGAPDANEIKARVREYFDPYHAALAAEVERLRSAHGFAVVLDAHSIRSRVPRFFAGRLPDLNLGTADGSSCGEDLQARAWEVLAAAAGFSAVCNGRFKGGYITRQYGRPATHVHALQLEIAQACYMHEDPPYAWEPERASALIDVCRRLVAALLV